MAAPDRAPGPAAGDSVQVVPFHNQVSPSATVGAEGRLVVVVGRIDVVDAGIVGMVGPEPDPDPSDPT
jgi:hypothetical protein